MRFFFFVYPNSHGSTSSLCDHPHADSGHSNWTNCYHLCGSAFHFFSGPSYHWWVQQLHKLKSSFFSGSTFTKKLINRLVTIFLCTGFVADKCGNYKTVLSLSILTTAAFHTLLLFVPPYFDQAEVPVTFEFNCLTDYSYFLIQNTETNPNKMCHYPQLPPKLTVLNCSYSCPEGQ